MLALGRGRARLVIVLPAPAAVAAAALSERADCAAPSAIQRCRRTPLRRKYLYAVLAVGLEARRHRRDLCFLT